ncbi:HNH endonuclease [Sphaerisporangium aureirubrum]|uniref:HNH endonuclease n=1 Tax=Sphaerisporangium aureirubrum TaxID=1544736 RepID=A0ABW1NCD2_9ACTN
MSVRPNSDKRQRYRRQLAARDGAACFYCGHRFRDLSTATIDHLVPVYYGGTWARANLVLACFACNQAKGHRLPTEFLCSRGYRPGLRPRRAAVVSAYVRRVLTRTRPYGVRADVRTNRSRRYGPIRAALRVVPVLLALGWMVTHG